MWKFLCPVFHDIPKNIALLKITRLRPLVLLILSVLTVIITIFRY